MDESENYIEIRIGSKFCRAELRDESIDAIAANDSSEMERIVPKLVRAIHLHFELEKRKEANA